VSRPFVPRNRGWKRPDREAKLLRASKVSVWRWWDVCVVVLWCLVSFSCGGLLTGHKLVSMHPAQTREMALLARRYHGDSRDLADTNPKQQARC
jgi:hypothetical protein